MQKIPYIFRPMNVSEILGFQEERMNRERKLSGAICQRNYDNLFIGLKKTDYIVTSMRLCIGS